MDEIEPVLGNPEREEVGRSSGLPLRQARQAQDLTWYGLAKRAGIPNANTVRDVEYGPDAQLSTMHALTRALGLRLELVEERV